MSEPAFVNEVRRMYKEGVLLEAGVKRYYMDLGFDDAEATRLTDLTLKPETRRLELTEPELRKLLSVCAKELIPQLYHNKIEPELLSLLNKGTEALAPKAETDVKEKTPG